MTEEMEGKVLISHQSRHSTFANFLNKVLFPICTLNWRVNNYVSRHGRNMKGRNESTIIIKQIAAFGIVEEILFHY